MGYNVTLIRQSIEDQMSYDIEIMDMKIEQSQFSDDPEDLDFKFTFDYNGVYKYLNIGTTTDILENELIEAGVQIATRAINKHLQNEAVDNDD